MSTIFDKNMKKLKFWSLAYLLLVGKGIIINLIFFASQWFFLNVWAHFKKVGKRCKYLSGDF